MKKKIMLMVPMLHQGGFERVCVTTARLLAPYADVTIVVFNLANLAYSIDGLSVIDIALGVKKGKLGKVIQMLRRSLKVRSLKKELCPDVVYSFGPTANMVNILSKTKHTRIWLGLRNYTDLEATAKVKLYVKRADLIICCSRIIEEELSSQYHFTNTTTLYNLYDVSGIQKEAAAKEPELPWQNTDACLVSMGRDDNQKGFWHMLRVFAAVKEKHADARLLILGAGTFSEYRKMSEILGLSDSVYFAGMQKEPYHYLKKGKIYLLTSFNEGFPNALVEGMALGLAAVSTDCKTGPAEILLADPLTQSERDKQFQDGQAIWGDYGILLPVMGSDKDTASTQILPEERRMADVIIKLLDDPVLLEQYGKAAAERVNFFSYETYLDQLLTLINDTVRR